MNHPSSAFDRLRLAAVLTVLVGFLPRPAVAAHQAKEGGDAQADVQAARDAKEREDELAVRSGSVVIEGRELAYETHTGRMVLAEEDGEPKAKVFYVYYRATGTADEDGAERPITFCFNGGPGSSSVWLHLGLFGPRRVPMDDAATLPAPPFTLVDNPYSVLDQTDLVFIDPVTTGYSRAASGEDDGQFHGLRQDVEAVGEFIRLFTTRERRWSSPKYLAGESYGTTRAAALAQHLQGRHGMNLNGILLVSAILNFQTARFDVGNDLPYPLFLPTYTATAAYHGRLDAELMADVPETLREVEAFALGEYWSALAQGSRLAPKRRDALVGRLARYTGLSEDYVRATNLRIHIGRFTKELRRSEGVTVGRLDSRFTAVDRDAAGERYEFDPSYAAIQGAYTACLNAYVREELGFESDLPYEILTGRVRPWSYASHENRYVNVAEDLRGAMARNPHLEVWIASGIYDLATPYFATRYTVDHMSFEPGFRERIRIHEYASGHMMYVHEPSLVAQRGHLVEFYRRTRGD